MEHAKNVLANEALNSSSSTIGPDPTIEIRTPGSERGLTGGPQSHYIKRQGDLFTLDEPLKTTIVNFDHQMRDLKMIAYKAKQLLTIRKEAQADQDHSWDLWGPFLICLLLSR